MSIVDEEAARLDLLIGDAVEMAEIDANVVKVHLVPQHPRALLDQAVEESRKVLGSRRVTINVEGPDDSDKPAWFDPHLLSRVLRHLLENAAGHTPAGEPRSRSMLARAAERLNFCRRGRRPGHRRL